MRIARKNKIITGLPDSYGRGRIVGDYRRVALYGIDALIEAKQADKREIAQGVMNNDSIRQSEELFQQISFLSKLKEMAAMYGYDSLTLPHDGEWERFTTSWTHYPVVFIFRYVHKIHFVTK